MANSKYEYVKSFESNDKLMPSTWIVVRIDGRGFKKFSEDHGFDKPNDEQALYLMNECAVSMLQEFPDIVFAYGVSDEYSFIFRKETQFYQRRASKILSVTVSFFTSVYAMKWKEFFPQNKLKYPPTFDGRVVCYPSTTIVQDYLAWRQVDCHINNLNNTCYWMLVKSGKSKREAQDFLEGYGLQFIWKVPILSDISSERRYLWGAILDWKQLPQWIKGTQAQEKNELLFQQFNLNYNTLPAIFRKGSSVFRDKVEDIVKYTECGDPVKRSRLKVITYHCDMIEKTFWDKHQHILK